MGSLRRIGAWYPRRSGVLIVAMSASACDQEIDPFQSTEMAFSIYGHFDAGADTQWVRVAPFRTSIFSTPDPVDAVVSVEELGTGRRIELEPVPFVQGSGNFGDTLYAYNFRTTQPIEYGESYRLVSRRSDGSESSSMAHVPPDHSHFQTVIGRRRTTAPSNILDYVRYRVLPGVHSAMVQTRVLLEPSVFPEINECRPILEYNVLPTPPPLETGGEVQVTVRIPGWPHNVNVVPLGCEKQGLDVRIIRSGEAWPFSIGDDYTHAQAFSNIENGVGFFGGVITSTTFMDECVISGPGVPTHCEFYYGPGTSTLTVVPINDSGWPHDYVELGLDLSCYPFSSTVTLRKEGETWIRQGDAKGIPDPLSPTRYHYPGLLPERVHIKVEGQLGPRGLDCRPIHRFYCEERTIDLVPGDQQIEFLMMLPEILPNEPVNANGCREG